jgi:hypothetical protein
MDYKQSNLEIKYLFNDDYSSEIHIFDAYIEEKLKSYSKKKKIDEET